METTDQTVPSTGQGVSDVVQVSNEAGSAAPGSGSQAVTTLHELLRCGEHINAARCGVEESAGNPHNAALVVALDELCGAVGVLAGIVANMVTKS